MSVKTLTTWPTEADLEAAVPAAIQKAFPWLPQGSIRHQLKFSFSFGRKKIEVDATASSRIEARADILLCQGKQPLAIMELKRNGEPLTAEDEAQGLSYARMLTPRAAPLVMVTNGDDVRLLETHSGTEWHPSQPGELAFQQLVEAAARAASNDLKNAIATLMGSSSQVWVQAVRQASAAIIGELTGTWTQAELPFVGKFLIPRNATVEVINLLRQGKRFVTVEGPPLIGKSSVLRELADKTNSTPDIAVLFVDASSGTGLFQVLADILRNELSWPVTPNEAREWLLRLSLAGGPDLVLAFDGLSLERNDILRDVEDLTSGAFGSGVKVVLAADDVIAEKLMSNSRGFASAIGRRAVRVMVGPIDNQEFAWVEQVMRNNRLVMTLGAAHAEEYRIPWVLRAVGAQYEGDLSEAEQNLAAGVPPLLGLELIAYARRQFTDHELRRLFRSTADAVVVDAQDESRSVALILQAMATFVVRRKTLRRFLEADEIAGLVNQGFLRPFQPQSGEALLVVRLAELLASEIADILGKQLANMVQKGTEDAADWIAGAASNLPLGDVIAAQAICDAAKRHGGVPFKLIEALLGAPPKCQAIGPGTRGKIHLPDVGTFGVTFKGSGFLAVEIDGQEHIIELEQGEEQGVTYENYHTWLILSHLAGVPFSVGDDQDDRSTRIDPVLLREVGTFAAVLRHPGGDPNIVSVLTHEVPEVGSIVCHHAGIVEAITWSMFRYLSAEGPCANDWVHDAVNRRSLPLLARIDIALRLIASTANQEMSTWAVKLLEDVVRPALQDLPPLHYD